MSFIELINENRIMKKNEEKIMKETIRYAEDLLKNGFYTGDSIKLRKRIKVLREMVGKLRRDLK